MSAGVPVDPRTYGVGTGDLVDVVVRGRVQRIGALSLSLVVPTGIGVRGLDEGESLEVWIPAEGIISAALTPETTP